MPTIDRDSATPVYRSGLAAGLAYLSRAALQDEASKVGFVLAATLQRGPHNAVVLDDHATRIIAFRGTDERADWRTNLNVLFRSTPWGLVHRGFQDAVVTFGGLSQFGAHGMTNYLTLLQTLADAI